MGKKIGRQASLVKDGTTGKKSSFMSLSESRRSLEARFTAAGISYRKTFSLNKLGGLEKATKEAEKFLYKTMISIPVWEYTLSGLFIKKHPNIYRFMDKLRYEHRNDLTRKEMNDEILGNIMGRTPQAFGSLWFFKETKCPREVNYKRYNKYHGIKSYKRGIVNVELNDSKTVKLTLECDHTVIRPRSFKYKDPEKYIKLSAFCNICEEGSNGSAV